MLSLFVIVHLCSVFTLSLGLVIQPALGPQCKAVGRDEVDPVLQILWDFWNLHLKQTQNLNCTVLCLLLMLRHRTQW